ncbi:helix-turn-helix domain-containing protein [Mucilaginibacter sp. X5P1]|uniref:helix-turn-helix domain-containing protein n=1 Tax=Mucilaginibacter sp. X5P1 TaxID=2723088 RepID=UPI0017B7285A|nr:helix-turn-helix domain-containing protein [Mucilaginibacter sp. X5P1]MBB6139208.1 HTH-type transcriptional regulator/antitoxin HigA [Mucilaginibacter sp. X5P1]
MEKVKKINNENDYTAVMAKIDSLMAKGSANVSKIELGEIRELALAAQDYEQQKYVVATPSTLNGMIEMRMYEMRLKQTDLAKKLKISDAKLSLIMNGKQKPDVDFLKAVHTELHVDAEFILQHV